MPYAPKRPCRHPGCPETADATYCEKHRKTKQNNESKARDRGPRLYDTQRWRRLRKVKLGQQPLCEACLRQGITRPAKHVHHKQRAKDNPEMAYELSNLESLCHSCHSAETAAENKWSKQEI